MRLLYEHAGEKINIEIVVQKNMWRVRGLDLSMIDVRKGYVQLGRCS